MNLAILVSGGGTNLQSIIDAINNQDLNNVNIACVIADRNCLALERALSIDIPTWFVERGENLTEDLNGVLSNYDIDLIVLAGFLSILPEEFCNQWNRKIINLHPSLLPKYGGKGMYGKHVHKAVIANHEKESGATVHYVTAGIDEGEIIAQASFKIKANENADWLAYKVSEIEKPLLIKAINQIKEEIKK